MSGPLRIAVKLISTFVLIVVLCALQRLIFIAVYHHLDPDAGFLGFMPSMLHGIPMDCTVAGYLTAIPGLMAIAGVSVKSKWLAIAEKTYYAIIALILALIFCLDIVLYGYWDFRLDSTPLFYFTTSPSSALASATTAEMLLAPIAVIAAAAVIYLLFIKLIFTQKIAPGKRKAASYATAIIMTALLFIPIRGGFTVSTMNVSRAYFSTNTRLNHAAVNPVFSLLYSATHQTNFAAQYRFFSDDEAKELFAELNRPDESLKSDSIAPLLNTSRPDICLIILESFSSHLMPVLGGEDIASGLDSTAREGMLFTNAYASSFRTDRALPAILGAFPAQPSTSLMKFVEKTEKLPSLPMSLRKAGYENTYYYGGDANFTNMRAYLANCGFGRIISDTDFTIKDKLSKWGVHDHLLFQRAFSELSQKEGDAPRFSVIQTSSSHEPFEVPYSNPRFADSPQKNAFAYTDSCLTDFINRMKATETYRNTLFIIVPDHYGAYPARPDDALDRHHVPVVFCGGALARTGEEISVPASQTDIAATVLSALSLPTEEFIFSHDLLNPVSPKYAFFSEPSLIGFVTENDTVTINCDSETLLTAKGNDIAKAEAFAKAYLQTIYDQLSR